MALIQAGTFYCTGTLVAPRVVVTAGHCLDADPPDLVFFGSAAASGGPSIPVAGVVTAPGFDGFTLADDLGVVYLGADPPASAVPVPWLQTPPAAALAGQSIRIVGFGTTSAGDTMPVRKRSGATVIDSADAATFAFHAMPSQTCKGDSGGPAFAQIGGVETLIGVTSQGDASCLASATDTRVDAHATFLLGFIAEVAPGAARPGQRCYADVSCATGSCYAPADAPDFSYCSPTCAGAADCTPPLRCEDRACRYPLPSPGALGAVCAANDDCGSGFCVHDGAAWHCSQLCFEDDAEACPAGFACKANPDTADTSACLVEASPSGCAVGRTGTGPDSWSLALVAVVAAGAGVRARQAARRRQRAHRAQCDAKSWS